MQATSIKQFASHKFSIVAIAAAVALTGALVGRTAETSSHTPLAISQTGTFTAQHQERAFSAIGLQGEGLSDPGMILDFSVMQRSATAAFLGLGQGEGFVGPGATVNPRVLRNSSAKAYLDMYQGEGLVDQLNTLERGREAAHTSVDRADDLIKRGVGN